MEYWTRNQVKELIQEQLEAGNITPDDILDALGNSRPLKLIDRKNIIELIQKMESYQVCEPAPVDEIADAVIAEIESNAGINDLSWEGIEATIEAVIDNWN